MSLSHEELVRILDYDPVSGIFRWKENLSSRNTIGRIAGSVSKITGYVQIRIRRKLYYAHRLAWFYVHKNWPINVDHQNLDRADNRLDNLREATKAQNNRNALLSKNNSSGYKGVFKKSENKFFARISHKSRSIHIGCYETAEDAAQAYDHKAIQLYGNFAQTNKMLGLIP